MKLKVKKLNFEAGNVKVVVLNAKDAAKLGQKAGDRLLLKKLDSVDMKPFIVLIDIAHSDKIVAPGEVGIFLDVIKRIGIENEMISVVPANPPESYKFIQKKVHGQKLSTEEINQIISDSVSGRLSPIEY